MQVDVKVNPCVEDVEVLIKYALYHVNQLHIASAFARWVYDLPGEICCFLRFPGAGRGRHIAASERSGISSFIFSLSRRSEVRR